jgi:TonB family protein
VSKARIAASIHFALPTVVVSSALLLAQSSPTFPPTPSPGEAIQSAARAYAQQHTRFGNIDLLTDTQGVDFGPYLHDFYSKVQASWYALLPPAAYTKHGKLAIEFAISNDGSIGAMRLVAMSGDESLDHAAWESIKAAAPFPSFPAEFKGDQLVLRCLFLYNPLPEDRVQSRNPIQINGAVTHAELIQSVADSNVPQYPEQAHSAKIDGVVRLEATIGTDGAVKVSRCWREVRRSQKRPHERSGIGDSIPPRSTMRPSKTPYESRLNFA